MCPFSALNRRLGRPRRETQGGEGSRDRRANSTDMTEPAPPARIGRRVIAWLLGWCMAAAFYLLLIDITDLPELLVGAGAAALAATGLELAREQGIVAESIRVRWLLHVPRVVLRVPADIAVVSLAALRAIFDRGGVRGSFRSVPFACGEQQELETGRRALAEALGSLAPNTFVVGIDVDRELIIAHQLRPTSDGQAIDVLELG